MPLTWPTGRKKEVVTLKPKGNKKGSILLSYLHDPVTWRENNPHFAGHSNKWESWAIAHIFQSLGYEVDAISWLNSSFTPTKNYDVVFDIFTNLARLAPTFSPATKKLLHLTGSYAPYHNKQEQSRITELEKRKSITYPPERLVSDIDRYKEAVRIADACSLIGSPHTLSTFPKSFHKKITCVTVSASTIRHKKEPAHFAPKTREFLWFFGGGPVHKGLDLVLDVFEQLPNVTLHVVGNLEAESAFWTLYQDTLRNRPNIHYHGYLSPDSKEFQSITHRVCSFIAPSCSESISTAVATCLQIGLYPIVSFDTGVVLPANCGIYLEKVNRVTIQEAVLQVTKMNQKTLSQQIMAIQTDALKRYSRHTFWSDMTQYITKVIEK